MSILSLPIFIVALSLHHLSYDGLTFKPLYMRGESNPSSGIPGFKCLPSDRIAEFILFDMRHIALYDVVPIVLSS